MWSPDDCASPEDDLEALAEIFQMCAGDFAGEGRDHDGRNASLDAIRQMLVHDFPPNSLLRNPLASLTEFVIDDTLGWKMVRDLLVYGICADAGWTPKWLDNWMVDRNGTAGDVDFLMCLVKEFAKAKAGGDAPDPMARCAYHDHPSVEDRLLCEGRI